MIINIEGKDYELVLGIDFIRRLDEKYSYDIGSGLKFGVGVTYIKLYLERYSPTELVEALSIAGNISVEKAEKYVESLDMEELEKLFNDFLSLLNKTPLTALQLKKGEEQSKKVDMTKFLQAQMK